MGRSDNVLNRLETEQLLCADHHFFTVRDAEPVTTDHRLLVSRQGLPSLADCDVRDLDRFLSTIYAATHGRADFLFERGRAAFCTSFDGVVIGHAHLSSVPELAAIQLDTLGAQTYASLAEALQSMPRSGEYLLWGRVFGEVAVSMPRSPVPKRLIRNSLQTTFGKS